MLTPGIAVGYWKQRNRPSRARASAREREQILATEGHRATGHDVLGMTHERVREGALARAVRPHQRMDLALRNLEVDPFEDLLALDCRVEAGDRKDRFAHRAGSRGRCHRVDQRLIGHELGERGLAEHRVDALLEAHPQPARRALALALAGAADVAVGDAFHRGDLALDHCDDVEHADLLGRPGERVPAVHAARALDEPTAAQLRGELLEIRERQVLDASHLGDAQRTGAIRLGELGHHAQAVVSLGTHPHRERSCGLGRWDRMCAGARRLAPGSRESRLSWSELYPTRPFVREGSGHRCDILAGR